ncbi:MAG: tandem-95 repeat protein [Chloroflexi bacterium]|nr:tandem-95 repeat protein [Chloroflexota bacterium]
MSSGIRRIRVAQPAPVPTTPDRLNLPRVVTAVLVLTLIATAMAPAATFAGTRAWSLSRTPASVTGPSSSVQVTATNIGDDGGGEAVGCVIVSIPRAGFTVTGVVIDLVSDGDKWSASYSVGLTDTLVRITSDSGGGNRLHGVPSEWVAATISFDTVVDGTYAWVGNAYNKEDCTDSFLQPHSVLVTVNGAAPNLPPVGVPDSFSTTKNAPLIEAPPGVLANDTDPDGDPLAAQPVGVRATANGTVDLAADGSFTYTPNAGFTGTDTFTYRASDGGFTTLDQLVTITVSNTPPTAVADPDYATSKNAPLTVAAGAGVLANDTDADGDALTVAPSGVRATSASGSANVAADGSFTYTPAAGFTGVDTFTYRASDGTASSSDTLVTVTVSNTAPVAVADGPYAATEDVTLTVNAASGVLANDADADGDALTATVVTSPTKGSLTLNANGSFTYVPVANATGADSFTYRAFDGSASSAETPVSLTIAAVNDPPIAAADAFAAVEDTTLVQGAPGVLANDADPDGDPLTATLVSPPASGSLVLDPDGSFTYVPAANAHGPVTFRYRATDGTVSSGPAVVTISVAAVNDRPSAVGDSALSPHASPVDIDVLANDSDVDGDALVIASLTQPSQGSVAVVAGMVRYLPPGDFIGATAFSYTVSDGALTDTATVNVVVGPPAPATPTPQPSPSPTARPTSTPTPTPTPTAAPTEEPTPAAVAPAPSPTEPPADPTPSPRAPIAGPDRDPQTAPQIPTEPVLAILPVAQLTASTVPGTQTGFGGFGGLFGDMSGGLTWAVPAAALGVPGLLFMAAVGSQVAGAAVWVPTARRSLAGIGLRRRRTTGSRS